MVALVVVVGAAGIAYAAIGSGGASPAATPVSGASEPAAEMQGGSASSGNPGTWANPALSSLAMQDSEGYPITLGTLCDGRVTVINVWATWCPYCIDEMNDYQALFDKYGKDIQFIMLDTADSPSEVQKAAEYVNANGFTFPVFYDDGHAVCDYFKVHAYPTTIVIGADGTVLNNRPGRINAAGMDAALANLV
ncbi:MAG TPA: hypothetical protein DCP91_06190 [Eggerthellaceae bacterium]|nr:hypothetical protein [Eggerthellaceae bacterium]